MPALAYLRIFCSGRPWGARLPAPAPKQTASHRSSPVAGSCLGFRCRGRAALIEARQKKSGTFCSSRWPGARVGARQAAAAAVPPVDGGTVLPGSGVGRGRSLPAHHHQSLPARRPPHGAAADQADARVVLVASSSVAICQSAGDESRGAAAQLAASDATGSELGADGGSAEGSAAAAGASAGEGPSFLESMFGDCLSYPNVVGAQEVLAAVHEATGLPWWLAIAATTLMARSLMLPLAVYQQKIAAHLQAAAPKLQEVEQEYQLAKTVYKDPGADNRRARKLAAIYKQHNNCKPWKLFANIGIQAPMFVSFFFGVKDMARTHPDFAQGGFLWAQDLSLCDPLHLLPMMASCTLLAALEGNLRTRRNDMDPMHFKMQVGVQRIICFSMVPLLVGLKYPAGVFVYWISNNLFTGLQVAIFSHVRVRKALGLPQPQRVASPFSAAAIKEHVDASFPPHKRGN